MKLSSHELGLRSVLDALGPYLNDLLLVGGWAVYLHLKYGRAAPDGGRTSLTAEADLLIPGELDPAGRAPLARLLKQERGRSRRQGLSLKRCW